MMDAAQECDAAPGEAILTVAGEQGLTRQELAARLGYSTRHLKLLVAGHLPLAEGTADRLHKALGTPVLFWLTCEERFRQQLNELGAERPDEMTLLQTEFAQAITDGDEVLANDLLACVFSKCAITAMRLVGQHGMLVQGEHRMLAPPSTESVPDGRDRLERQNG